MAPRRFLWYKLISPGSSGEEVRSAGARAFAGFAIRASIIFGILYYLRRSETMYAKLPPSLKRYSTLNVPDEVIDGADGPVEAAPDGAVATVAVPSQLLESLALLQENSKKQ